ncbi:MAG: apolipoprotein N-acyltransferase [Acidobacteria bacterium]|nr:apolipoprotein N-acyltransferase [Acidobacteriota bacterium]
MAVALAPLLMVSMHEPRGVRRFLLGMLSGCVFFAGTCYWIYNVMRDHGGLGVIASAGVFVLFFLTLAIYFGLFAYSAGVLWRVRWGALAIPFVWVALELARAYLLSGFPWLLAGYALTDTFGIARVARWTGVYGLSFLILTWNVAIVWFVTRRDRRAALIVAAVAAVPVLLVATARRESHAENQTAYLVQTNIPESVAFEPWDPVYQAPLLSQLKTLTVETVGRQQTPSLVIWPETPAPFYFEEGSFARQYAEQIARGTNSYFVLGIVGYVAGSNREKPLNSEVLISPSGAVVSQYDKIHLVPFGEYVPLKQWLTFADKLTAEVSDFVPGNQYVVHRLPGGKMAGFICYESVFPDLVRRFVRDGAEVLVNTSNDGWYGSSAARYQHLLMARMRAVENARYLLRATNTGVTAVIRPDGGIANVLPVDEPGVLQGHWASLQQQTFYTRHGDLFAYAACVLSVLALAAGWISLRRHKNARQTEQVLATNLENRS